MLGDERREMRPATRAEREREHGDQRERADFEDGERLHEPGAEAQADDVHHAQDDNGADRDDFEPQA